MLEPGKGMDPGLSFGLSPLFQCLLSTKSHPLRENIQTGWTLDSGLHSLKSPSHEYHFLRQVPRAGLSSVKLLLSTLLLCVFGNLGVRPVRLTLMATHHPSLPCQPS